MVLREVGAVEDNRLRTSRQRNEPICFAPGAELLPVVGIGADCRPGAGCAETGFRLGEETGDDIAGGRQDCQFGGIIGGQDNSLLGFPSPGQK